MLFDTKFIRSVAIQPLLQGVKHEYGLSLANLGIPESLFSKGSTLIPINEVTNWLQTIARLVDNRDFVIELASLQSFRYFGIIGQWFFSAADLSLSLRRINYGMSCIQSGGHLYFKQSGNIIKWTYQQSHLTGEALFHDAMRMLLLQLDTLRHYIDKSFTPLRILLPGHSANSSYYEQILGCSIEWNAPQTEIWFRTDLLNSRYQQDLANTGIREQDKQANLVMDFQQLDELLNMPVADGDVKIIYEVVNYSRHFGLPTLARVSQCVNLSEQQFQRGLHEFGFNFTSICNYSLCNIALSLLNQGLSITEVAEELGYSNCQSFSKMFKKQRGLTPLQYLTQRKAS